MPARNSKSSTSHTNAVAARRQPRLAAPGPPTRAPDTETTPVRHRSAFISGASSWTVAGMVIDCYIYFIGGLFTGVSAIPMRKDTIFLKQNLDPSVGSVGARGGRPCSDDSSERDARGENPAGIGTKKRRESGSRRWRSQFTPCQTRW